MAKPWLTVALAYHKLGKPVIPLCPPDHARMSEKHLQKCEKPGKTPLVAGWQRYCRELPSIDDLKTWARQWPQANIGGPTGPLWGVALDVDIKNGGTDTLRELVAVHGSLPSTVESLTGGGGRHILFQHVSGLKNAVALAPGLDLRAEGGQICLPPSVHVFGSAYAWELSSHPAEVAIAAMPVWLLDIVLKAEERPDTLCSSGNGHAWIVEALAGVPEGERDDTCIRLAGYFRNLLPLDVTLSILRMWGKNCHPVFPPDVVELKVQSAYRYPQNGVNGHPRAVVNDWVRGQE
ncbi:MAG: bifunctional DNA primase/polymerase [Dehalococcoidia bacterium]|nr:bifunctional DNA primase/polymerase [Dehalococcoidia bacterium]